MTGLDWLLSHSSSVVTAASLRSELTSEIDVFNLLWRCPDPLVLQWLVAHLLMDIEHFGQQEDQKLRVSRSLGASQADPISPKNLHEQLFKREFKSTFHCPWLSKGGEDDYDDGDEGEGKSLGGDHFGELVKEFLLVSGSDG